MPSLEGATSFGAESVDVVFVDGLHTGQGVHDDMEAWWPKVKPGGMMIMNDYGHANFANLTRTVDQWAAARGLQLAVGKRGEPPGVGNAAVSKPGRSSS